MLSKSNLQAIRRLMPYALFASVCSRNIMYYQRLRLDGAWVWLPNPHPSLT